MHFVCGGLVFLAGFEFCAAVSLVFPGGVVVSVVFYGEFDPGSG